MQTLTPGFTPIENHGVIGDLYTVALVALDGTIDFCCFPDFDSPSVFTSLLNPEQGGSFKLAPVLEHLTQRQIYFPDTNVLLTRFLSQSGVAELTDFMPLHSSGSPHAIVRSVTTIRGELRYRMECAPRFDYARAPMKVESEGASIIFSNHEKGEVLRLRATVPLRVENGKAIAEFSLASQQSAYFILEPAANTPSSEAFTPHRHRELFSQTVSYWRDWVAQSKYKGRWREIVNRSALVLKLLSFHKSGAMVAAPTFSLPEQIGGSRNWDYRYTWIRDTSFAMYCLMTLGFLEEARGFMGWIERRCHELGASGSLQVMYGIHGQHDLTESILEGFPGYLNSRPVRIGNNAYDQLQLDIYGELLDAVYTFDKHFEPISHDFWLNLKRIVEWVQVNWRRQDKGIWEVRGGPKEFLYSRFQCWIALDRALRIAHNRSFPGPIASWRQTRDAIYESIYTDFWDAKRKAFVMYKGADTTDAATLVMPLMKFISPSDPRWLSTLRAIEQDLVSDSLVYRYRGDPLVDGLHGTEGTFSMCSFWYVNCLTLAGDTERARFAFEKMLSFANHLGLFSEELGPTGQQLGNFPQALTHLALIGAAVNLDAKLSRQGQGV